MTGIIRIPITVRRTPEASSETTEEQAQTAQDTSASQPKAPEAQHATDPAILAAMRRALEGSELLEEATLQAFVLDLLEVGDNLERALRFA
ncbi:MAG: hypothetical protein GX552_02225, partial [Chloroflexi bacterium]|nr:hypothetical protein [Chloroflexota bacterium]